MSPCDALLMYETGHFASLWKKMAERLSLRPEFLGLPGAEGWRHGVDALAIERRLRADAGQTIKAVCVVHNETSTGVTSDIAAVRRAIDAAGHPALLMVDTISGLASADYRHDEWGVDVSISGSPRGRRRAHCGARLGPADPVRRPGAVFTGADRGDHARGCRRRSHPAPDPRALRPLARHRTRQGEGPHVPDRPPRRQQRPDLARH